MLIRRETAADGAAIDAVHGCAFPEPEGGGEPIEVGLVHALRADPGWIPALSLVAEDDDGTVVGHVVCTRGHVADTPAVGLGPIGVRPEHQRRGVGLALMHAVVVAADALGEPLVAVLGEPAYYGRFGFVPASTLGIAAPDPAWADYFQVRTLSACGPDLTGTFRYANPFTEQ